jgi:hypothetical protein
MELLRAIHLGRFAVLGETLSDGLLYGRFSGNSMPMRILDARKSVQDQPVPSTAILLNETY